MKAQKRISELKQKREDARQEIVNHPEEWDFRSITEDDLHLAILYEYARSENWVVHEFEQWHKQSIRLPAKSKSFKTWQDKNVREALNFILTSPENLPPDVGLQLFEVQPRLLKETPLVELTDISIHFPLPFAHLRGLPKPVSLEHLVPRWKKEGCGFEVIDSLPNYSRHQLESSAKAGILYLTVKVDLRVGKTKLADDAKNRLLKLYEENPTAKMLPVGGAAVLPWTELKELAAYRLHKAGFDHKAAKSFLDKFSKENPVSVDRYEDDILPRYKRTGWWDAIANAKKRIQKLYPIPAAVLSA